VCELSSGREKQHPMTEFSYSIGDAAEAAGVTVKAIRHYEKIGLIPNAMRRRNGHNGLGHRIFSAEDVGRLRFIHDARTLGLSLSDVRELVSVAEGCVCPGCRPKYQGIMTHHLTKINEKIENLERLRSTVEDLLNIEKSGGQRFNWANCGCMKTA
jgi:MerR family transcriptional regulator, copper efflux regulator